MEDQPLITVILPTYQRPLMLKRAIQSVLNQTYPHFQVCVYDNASGDQTASVVKNLITSGANIRYHRHSTNIGMLENFQYGLKRVDTPFFSFLCDDDILLPSFFERALEGFEAHPDAQFSTGLAVYTDMRKVTDVKPQGVDGYLEPPESLLSMITGDFTHPVEAATLFRTEVIAEFGYLDLATGSLGEDLDYMFRIMAHRPVVMSNTPYAIRVNHPTSNLVMADYHQLWPGWLKMIQNFSDDERIPAHIQTQIRDALTHVLIAWLLSIGYENVRTGRLDSASKCAELLRDYFRLEEASEALYKYINLRKDHEMLFHLKNRQQQIVSLMQIRTQFVYRRKLREWQEKYGKYLPYVQAL
jgi:glycosyltransferase involved in cell wall biosynthesis